MLNPDSPIPLYHQLADFLSEKIRAGKFRPGDRIPSENKLAAAYAIGRPTVRQAIDMLVRKRLLIRKRGSGTYVQRVDEEVDLFSLAGTISSFHRKGLATTTRILRKIRVAKIGKKEQENPFAGGKAFYFERLTEVEGEPVLIETMYLHPELFKGIDEIDLKGKSLSEIVSGRYYMRPNGGKQNFRIGFLSGKRAEFLGVTKGTPILLVKRFLHFAQAENGLFSEIFCRTDQFVFSQTIGGLTDV
jgi:GntR family transcriptional regulator